MRGRTVTRIAAAAAALATVTGLTAAAPATTARSWKLRLAISYNPSAGHHSQYTSVLALNGVSWFFGGSNFAGHGVPEAERRQNGGWHPTALPSGLRSWITGASAVSARDIWAVTYLGGAVLHWNGSAWTRVASGRWNPDAQFTGIVTVGDKDVWLFGGPGSAIAGAGTWNWAGTRWTEFRGVAGQVYKASAASVTDIWGIGGPGGTMTTLLHFGGARWRQVFPTALAGFTYSYVLALGPGNVWVAGSVAGTPELGHFNGHRWKTLSMPGITPGTGMCRDGRDGLWVVANLGLGPSSVLDRSAAGQWATVRVSSSSADEVLGCALIPGTKSAWGVGKATALTGTAAAVYSYGATP